MSELVTKKVSVTDHAKTGAKFRRLRERQRISLRALGEKMGLSAMFICDMEHGRRNWSDGMVDRFMKALK